MANEENKGDENEESQILIDDDKIKEFMANPDVIKFIKNQVPRITKRGAQKLIELLLYQNTSINVSQLAKKPKGFIQYNMSKFEKDGKMKLDAIKNIRLLLIDYLNEIGRDIKVSYTLKKKVKDGIDTYILDKTSTYEKVRNLTCDEGGDVSFIYDFEKTDMKTTPPLNKATLQLCQIQILSASIKFDYPIEYNYRCSVCRHRAFRKAYEMIGSRTKYKCEGVRDVPNPQTGQYKSKVCNEGVYPEIETSLTKDAYYYDISYDDEEEAKQTTGAISFNKYEPGFYECVLFKIKNINKTEMFQVMDVKPLQSNKLMIPDKKKDENYLFTLQKAFDSFIREQTEMEIYGLIPIKVAMIVQMIISVLGFRLVANIQLVGDSSTGKSTILKYYGFLLGNQFNLSSNGLSISVPALRGTKQTITLMGKDQKIITVGYLGTFKSIHIDEAGENKGLVQNLKTFLLEENYGYDKAGATGVFNKRSAQINISENLDYNHLGQYIGSIRKAYKDMNITIGDEERVDWNEEWDLHKPLFEYTNPYLRKVIKDKRTEYQSKQVFWIDGYEWPLHERFPFYFYLVNQKKDKELIEVVKGNVCRDTIRENLELIKVLKCEDITKIFKLMKDYKESDDDRLSFDKVDEIVEEYGIETDVRVKEFFYMLVKISRIANMRNKITEEDYNLLRWFLEKTNCKLDVVDTVDYKISGPPDVKAEKEKDLKIEEETREVNGQFGLPEGEFE